MQYVFRLTRAVLSTPAQVSQDDVIHSVAILFFSHFLQVDYPVCFDDGINITFLFPPRYVEFNYFRVKVFFFFYVSL